MLPERVMLAIQGLTKIAISISLLIFRIVILKSQQKAPNSKAYFSSKLPE